MNKQKFVYFGGDYNPDQWDDATIDEDMRLFKLAGINLVTLPVFSWAKLEPDEGVYNFGWLDALMDKFAANGLKVCLATPTTAQPAWLSSRYPEVLPVDIAGRKRTHGMRVFFCVNSLKYRERAAAIAEQMAQRYKDHPSLAVWHVSNEYGTYCYCPTCQAKFRLWLKNRYGTIEELNRRWTTAFWGRTVYSFEEITLPTELNDDYRFNPVIQLDYMRFVTDSTAECFRNERDVLKRYTPDVPVTSNISGFIKKLNQRVMTRDMDAAGWDNYPWPHDEPSFIAFKHDIMRGLKGGAPFLLMEQSPNQQNWQPYNKLKRPGEVRLLSYQAMAHGADSCLFFQLRQSQGGQEKLHGAVIAHAGHENTRVFRETAKLGAELEKLGGAFVGGRTKAKAALLLDWESWWALEPSSGPSRDMDFLRDAAKYYKALYSQNIAVDVIGVDDPLDGYALVIAPMLYMMKPGVAASLTRYVEKGGTLVATTMTGIADENDRCVFGEYPGPLKEVLGVWVEETDALLPAERNRMLAEPGAEGLSGEYACDFLCDLLHLRGAEALCRFGDDFYAGMPAATCNSFGQGAAYYIGTRPEDAFLTDFFTALCTRMDIAAPFASAFGVEITERISDMGRTMFIINHNQSEAWVDFGNETTTDLLLGGQKSGRQAIAPRDVWVLRRNA